MADFKVGDRVRVRAGVKLWWPDDVPRDEIGTIESICEADGNAEIKFPSISFLFSAMLYDLELVSPAAPPQPDPRDAEIAALKAELAAMARAMGESMSRQADEGRAYYRQLVAHLSGGLMAHPESTTRADVFSNAVCDFADAVFAEVKRREAEGGAS